MSLQYLQMATRHEDRPDEPHERTWDPQEIQLLSEMVAKGASVVRAAGAFDRTTAAVRTHTISTEFEFARMKWAGADPSRLC